MKTFPFDKGLGLAELNQRSAQTEQIAGPLVQIGNDGTNTVLGYDTDQNPPAVASVIRAAPPAGRINGSVFVSGALTVSAVD